MDGSNYQDDIHKSKTQTISASILKFEVLKRGVFWIISTTLPTIIITIIILMQSFFLYARQQVQHFTLIGNLILTHTL